MVQNYIREKFLSNILVYSIYTIYFNLSLQWFVECTFQLSFFNFFYESRTNLTELTKSVYVIGLPNTNRN